MALVQMRKQMRYLMVLVWLFIAIFVLGTILMMSPGINGRNGRTAENSDLWARVAGHDVSDRQIMATVDRYQQMMRSLPVSQQTDLPKYAWDQVLQEYAQSAAAEAAGVTVSDSDVDAELNRQVDQKLETLAAGMKPEEKEDIRQRLLSGQDRDAFRRQLLGQKLQDKLQKEARTTEVKVAHVLIKTDKRTDAAAQKLAADIARRAKAGEDFDKLVKQYSEDDGSKTNHGIVGWVSAAQPGTKSAGPDGKPNAEQAGNFVPEFTAAALRLKPNQISDPVHSQFGYHVIKAIQEREFVPVEKDPKKKSEAIEQYKSGWATKVAQGLVSAQKQSLEKKVEPHSAWLKANLLEKEVAAPAPPDEKKAKDSDKKDAAKHARDLQPVINGYTDALKEFGSQMGGPLAYKISTLRQQAGDWYKLAGQDDAAKKEYQAGLDVLGKWVTRTGDPDLYIAQGDLEQKLANKADALTAYKTAMDRAKDNTQILERLPEKFKAVGRADLADEANAKKKEVVAKQEKDRKRQEEEQKKQAAEQAAKSKSAKTPPAPTTGTSAPSKTITVKTGPADPKTGKPTSVKVIDDGEGKKGDEKKPAATEKGAAKP